MDEMSGGNGVEYFEMPKRPRSPREKILGIIGGVAATAWIFTFFLRVIDSISRVQTLMSLGPYVHYLITWWAQLIELFVAVTSIVLATRIEQARETADAPRIILLATREPTPIKRDRLWMKVTAIGILLAASAAVAVFVGVRHSKQTTQIASVRSKSGSASQPGAAPSQSPTHSSEANTAPANPQKKNTKPHPVQTKSVSPSTTPRSTPIVIPVPDRPHSPKAPGEISVKYVASIDGQVVQASSKAPGKLTVALAVTNNSTYLGKVSSTDLDNVAEALKKTGKIDVFINKSAGSYSISGNGLGYSLSITQIHPKTIYFFDNRLESACAAVKTILSPIVGQMDCTSISVQPSSDPNQPNPQYDFLRQSGLDMEIDL